MVTRIDDTSNPLAPSVASQSSSQEATLNSSIDTYRDLAGLLVSGELAGTESGEFLKLFRSTTTEISLTDLPYEIASMILENRSATMKEFFESWSESLREQSKLDKEAHQRRETQRSGSSVSERHFISCLDAAQRTGKVPADEVVLLKGELNLLAADGDILPALRKTEPASDYSQTSLAALEPPMMGGVQLRAPGAAENPKD